MIAYNDYLKPKDYININSNNFPIAFKIDNSLLFTDFSKYFKFIFRTVNYNYETLKYGDG